ncbi:MAG: RnfABCDGE type electron transport complex subunit B [Gammaproteobacteria bacterium]|nr:RnfABCDGE type electron transport complex subunit B [Gammaproteobacteria bacterium]
MTFSHEPIPVSSTGPSAAIDGLADRIDALLPQTQCRQCGYAGCRPYAEAIARGTADINQCPPGGTTGIAALAALLACAPKPLNPKHGIEQPLHLAVIDEPRCIGCTLCIQACPVDAIVGAAKLMHTVIAAECTGCRLCIPPCPVECIVMVPAPPEQPTRPAHWRQRHTARQLRLNREQQEKSERANRQKAALQRPGAEEIARAIERARARKQALALAGSTGTPSVEPPHSEESSEA